MPPERLYIFHLNLVICLYPLWSHCLSPPTLWEQVFLLFPTFSLVTRKVYNDMLNKHLWNGYMKRRCLNGSEQGMHTNLHLLRLPMYSPRFWWELGEPSPLRRAGASLILVTAEKFTYFCLRIKGNPLPSRDWLIADTSDALSPPSPGIPFVMFPKGVPTQDVQAFQWPALSATLPGGWPIVCWASESLTRGASQKSKKQVRKGKTSEGERAWMMRDVDFQTPCPEWISTTWIPALLLRPMLNLRLWVCFC